MAQADGISGELPAAVVSTWHLSLLNRATQEDCIRSTCRGYREHGGEQTNGDATVAHNVPVQRRRAPACSAPHVHNEMTHLRRARADV